MGAIGDIYDDLETDVSEEEFRDAVAAKVEQMGGLADEETAAMLVAHELQEGEVEGVADVEPGMDEVKFIAKVTSVGDLRTFERDDDSEGRVVNVEAADETGAVRLAFWDERAQAVEEELEVGQVLRVKGRPREGYNGIEVSVDEAEPDDDVEVDVEVGEATVESLTLGQSSVNLAGLVLDTDAVRTFDRDDGSEGRVANLVLGDETGRIRVTLWDEQADRATELSPGTVVEVVDGYVRERDGDLELHVGNRGAVEETDASVEYVPETTAIEDLELGQTVDLAGVVRSADPKRTFERDDGSEGQVRNVRLQDETGDIRVALWGEKADRDLGPGDELQVTDVEVQEGWQDDLEVSAGWRSTVTVLEGTATSGVDARPASPESDSPSDAGGEDRSEAGLSAFAGGGEEGGGTDRANENSDGTGRGSGAETVVADAAGEEGAETSADEPVEFTGTVVQAGDPVVLDDGSETLSVEATADVDVQLGQQVTVRGHMHEGRLRAEDVF